MGPGVPSPPGQSPGPTAVPRGGFDESGLITPAGPPGGSSSDTGGSGGGGTSTGMVVGIAVAVAAALLLCMLAALLVVWRRKKNGDAKSGEPGPSPLEARSLWIRLSLCCSSHTRAYAIGVQV